MSIHLIAGNCLSELPKLSDRSVQCVVTSPPYFGLRDYGVSGQIGLEATLAEYVATIVAVFREVRRVLRDDGTAWITLGDSFRGKQLLMIPARVAISLQDDGWYLRSDIIWAKKNGLPESVTDRPTSAHEHVLLLTKGPRYFYDATSVREASDEPDRKRADKIGGASHKERQQHSEGGLFTGSETRNLRNVWTIATAPFLGDHFAVMPNELADRCIKAGSKPGDTILDPFGGAGTVGLVADRLQRNAILIELNPDYVGICQKRISNDSPLFAEVCMA